MKASGSPQQFLVQLRVHQVVQLSFGKHRQFGDGDLQFVHLQCNVIPVEITSMVNIVTFSIDDGIVAGGVHLVHENMDGIIYCIQYRPENLWNTSQGVILLNLVFEYLNINGLVVIVKMINWLSFKMNFMVRATCLCPW